MLNLVLSTVIRFSSPFVMVLHSLPKGRTGIVKACLINIIRRHAYATKTSHARVLESGVTRSMLAAPRRSSDANERVIRKI